MPYRQVIQTEFLGPTRQGTHIKATSVGKSATVSFPYDVADGHDRAALALIVEQGWWGRWVRGVRPDDQGWVYVWASDPPSGHPLTITIE